MVHALAPCAFAFVYISFELEPAAGGGRIARRHCFLPLAWLAHRYDELMESGWRVSRGDVRRDVARLLGGAYEEFIQKKL